MKKGNSNIHLDFEIDELTNSIKNTISGEIFDTDVLKIAKADVTHLKKSNWQFDWQKEIKKTDRHIFKLVTIANPDIIHGLTSITGNRDHVLMHLIENAKFNKGSKKLYSGVAGNLVAYGCKTSFEKGFDGILAFVAKSALIDHYKETLGAKQYSGNRMYIDTPEALKLVTQYYKTFKR